MKTIMLILVLLIFAGILAFQFEAQEVTSAKPDCPDESWVKNGNLYGCGTGDTKEAAETSAHSKNDLYCQDLCVEQKKGVQGKAQSCKKQGSVKSGEEYYYTEKCESCQCYDGNGNPTEVLPL